jgi:hypothetical protein
MTPTKKLDDHIRLVVDEMSQSRKWDGSGKLPHQFEFDHVHWKFDFGYFMKSIKDAKMHEEWVPRDWQTEEIKEWPCTEECEKLKR